MDIAEIQTGDPTKPSLYWYLSCNAVTLPTSPHLISDRMLYCRDSEAAILFRFQDASKSILLSLPSYFRILHGNLCVDRKTGNRFVFDKLRCVLEIRVSTIARSVLLIEVLKACGFEHHNKSDGSVSSAS